MTTAMVDMSECWVTKTDPAVCDRPYGISIMHMSGTSSCCRELYDEK